MTVHLITKHSSYEQNLNGLTFHKRERYQRHLLILPGNQCFTELLESFGFFWQGMKCCLSRFSQSVKLVPADLRSGQASIPQINSGSSKDNFLHLCSPSEVMVTYADYYLQDRLGGQSKIGNTPTALPYLTNIIMTVRLP